MRYQIQLSLMVILLVIGGAMVCAQPQPYTPPPAVQQIDPMGQPGAFVTQPPATANVNFMEADRPGAMSKNQIILIWVIIGFFLFMLHSFIGVYIGLDGRKRKVPGAIGWAIFGFIPVIGLIGLFVYLFVSNNAKSEDETKKLIERAIAAGQEKGRREAEARANSSIQALQDQLEQIKNSISEAPIQEEEVTEIITTTQGRSGIMLLHMGGERDGHPEQLNVRDAVRGTPKKIKLGRNANLSDIAIPGDKSVSDPHCEISFEVTGENDQYYVYDLNSSNGTFLRRGADDDFHEVQGRGNLKDGDILRIGNTQFRVVIYKPVKIDQVRVGDNAPPVSDFVQENSGV